MRTLFKLKAGHKEKDLILVHDFFAVLDSMMILMHDENASCQIAQLILKVDAHHWEIIPDGIDSDFIPPIIQTLEKHFSEAGYKFYMRVLLEDNLSSSI